MYHIACAADAAYLPHCAAMLQSVLARHAGDGVAVHFLHAPALRDTTMQPLAQMVRGQGGEWHAHAIPDAWVTGLPRIERIPPVMWYRIFLPQLLPDHARVLYLDCDTLLVDNLQPLWDTDLGDNYVAAVANVLEDALQDWPQQLGLAPGQAYFNSGVLLLNLEAMRRDAVTEQLATCGREQGARLRWPDQDALNTVLGPRCRLLHPRWNCQNSFFYYPRAREVFGAQALQEAVQAPGILHFEGHHVVKPWHYLSKHPYRRHYIDTRRHTPWPDIRWQEATLFNRLLRLLPSRGAFTVLGWVYRLRRKLGLQA